MEQEHSRGKAIDTAGAVLLEEIYGMLTETEPFDHERYVDRLEDL